MKGTGRPENGAAEGRLGEGEAEPSLESLGDRISRCRDCSRLVEWREQVGRVKRRSFQDEEYWARPVPGFGDQWARLLVLGLAPAAHGANRTGRVFTGDRSGDWLYRALHRAGYANREKSVAPGDGLLLRDAFVTAAVKCAPPDNRPLPEEARRCRSFLLDELQLLDRVRVILCLGGFAWTEALRCLAESGAEIPRPQPGFTHGSEASIGRYRLLGSYHPSQQNTFTGRLTEVMLDEVLRRARELVEDPAQPRVAGGR